MCLISKWRLPRLSIFPKTCYKVMFFYYPNGLESRIVDSYKSYSLGQEYLAEHGRYEKDGQYKKESLRKTVKHIIFRHDFWHYNLYEINGNFFHSYRSLKDAISDCDDLGLAVVKCRIPAFTWYYKGESSEYEPQYASRKIKFVRVLDCDEK